MDDCFKFTWLRMSLCFPEWKEDMLESDFSCCFPKSPNFSSEQISFAYKNEYGIQMFLNQTIPLWIKNASEKEYAMIEKMHSDLSHKLYNEFIKELDSSFETLEGWRKSISKHNGRAWEGNLSNHLDFKNENNTITLGDYYKFYINSDRKNNSPTDILHKIGKLPKDSLNKTWKKYTEFVENVQRRENKNTTNKITGRNLTECIKNADTIYKMASELEQLEF
jgi:hypothetical protein